ncbi:hypothetical protein SI65_01873 [Aspergillus cristatus]|uniref:Cytochrome c oxidase-assembly factor cox-23, mitochondrial n=1 Tax=Aspergillus cristatus TaxID=573508 RepID=A0A1E3BTH8_ASPCR|nr:hypothetical protein SI65_01873 [Aspergillus cristatus]
MASNENDQWQALPVDDANKTERKFSHKSASEYYDPCQDFADRSLKCMRRNGFDKEMCGDYFQAYRDCKKTWMTQRRFGSSGQK